MHPHHTPQSLNDPTSSGSSIVAPTSPYQPAVPAQLVQQSFLLQSNTHIDLSLIINHSPSPEQQDAVAILQLFPDDSIFAWLRGFRSFFRGEELFNPSQIPPQQRLAVSALKDCPDDLVLEWVTLARFIGQYPQTA